MLAAMRIGAILCILVGLIWVGQGLRLVPGGFMSGSAFWGVVGAVLVLAGLFLAYRGFYRQA